jgi:voltage-gated potassium channel
MIQQMRRWVFYLLEGEGKLKPSTFWVRWFIVGLILFNVILIVVGSISEVEKRYGEWLLAFEIFSLSVFTTEYILRIWSCIENPKFSDPVIGRLKYAFSFMAIIDFLACIPALVLFWLPLDLRILRVFRLFRLFWLLKLVRYSQALKCLLAVLSQRKEELLVTLMVGFLLLLISSSFMYMAEHEAQPEIFSSIPASMWWAVATLTTVGYGDIYPITLLGKIMGGFIAVLGIGLFALPAGILGSGLVEWVQGQKKIQIICPHCHSEIGSHDDKADS